MTDDEKVVRLDCVTRLDIPVEAILEEAIKVDLEEVVVIGWEKDGEMYFSSSKADGGDVLWLMEKAKKMLLEMGG